jgi:hypothetical protein
MVLTYVLINPLQNASACKKNLFWLSPVSNSYANLLILLKIVVRDNLLCHFTITNSSVLKYLCLLSEFGLPIKMFRLSTCPETSL